MGLPPVSQSRHFRPGLFKIYVERLHQANAPDLTFEVRPPKIVMAKSANPGQPGSTVGRPGVMFMAAARIEVFRKMLEADPANTIVRYGLANELIKLERYAEAIAEYRLYLDQADDQGAAYGSSPRRSTGRAISKAHVLPMRRVLPPHSATATQEWPRSSSSPSTILVESQRRPDNRLGQLSGI
jgi:hypothetical protein